MNRLILLVLAVLLCSSATVFAVPYQGYLFDYWSETVPAPEAYVPAKILSGTDLGVGSFNNPQDLFIDNDYIYVLDSGNNRIVVFDHDCNFVREIK